MNTNTLVQASSLSDPDLLARLETLASREREAVADLVAHLAVLLRAVGRTLSEIETLVAELAPRPDVPASVRKLPSAPMAVLSPETSAPAAIDEAPALSAPPPARRPVIQVTAPQRYRVQFT